jgi:hypothetical protein
MVRQGTGFRIIHDGLSKAYALHHALRECSDLLGCLRTEAHALQQLWHAPAQVRLGKTAQPTVEGDQLGGRKPVVKSEVLWQETDPGSNFPRTERVAEEQSMTATRPHKHQHP